MKIFRRSSKTNLRFLLFVLSLTISRPITGLALCFIPDIMSRKSPELRLTPASHTNRLTTGIAGTSKTKILSSDLAASQQILITVPGYLQDLQWDTRTEATHVKISVAQARRDPFARHHLPAEFVNREEAQEGKEGEDKKGKKTKRGREEEEENGVEEQQGEMIEFVKLSNYVKLPWCTPPVEEVVIRGLVKTLYIKQKSKIGVTAWQVL